MADFQLDTGLVIAAVVHDVKNSLGVMTHDIEEMSAALDGSDSEMAANLQRMSLETSRINNGLIHLLGLYRSAQGTMKVQLDEVMIIDLIEDVTARYQTALSRMNISFSVEVEDEDLLWVMDASLIEGILNNAVTNATRYTKSRLVLSTHVNADHELVFRLVDDGEGYPEVLLNCLSEDGDMDFKSGSTGLGLHFSEQIARQHANKTQQGRIRLSNDGESGGAMFELVLPWV